jgi:hypothetical protein
VDTNTGLTVIQQVDDIQLTATIPEEMANSQKELIIWCEAKIKSLKADEIEIKEAFEHAKEMKWKYRTLENQYKKYAKRISFYKKIKAALLEGYYIVPNFPVQMFAIRTKRGAPLTQFSESYWGDKKQNTGELQIGDGEYKNPFPIVERNRDKLPDSKEDVCSYATSWDEMEFPISMSKPQIMKATSRAMALKIFDEIGVFPKYKNEDPVIIGTIVQKNGYTTKKVSFMIAWHLNTNTI